MPIWSIGTEGGRARESGHVLTGRATPVPCQNERGPTLNWTRDRVRRLARIQQNALELSMDLRALIHELGPEDHGKEKLTAANEELHRAEVAIDETLDCGRAIWELTDAMTEFVIAEETLTV